MNSSIPIGNRPLSLAAHLRAAADRLLDTTTPSTYCWNNCTQCNVGTLAKVIGVDFFSLRRHMFGPWTEYANRLADPSWMSEPLQALLAAGMLREDIEHLEFLCHPELKKPEWPAISYDVWLKRQALGVAPGAHFAKVENAAYYLVAWAKAIEAFHANATVQSAPKEQVTSVQGVLPDHPTEASLEAVERRPLANVEG